MKDILRIVTCREFSPSYRRKLQATEGKPNARMFSFYERKLQATEAKLRLPLTKIR